MREKILRAAEEMVQESGLSGVSFARLAKAVGLSKPSIFHHFPNKEALAKALVDQCQCKYVDEYTRIIGTDADAGDKLRGLADSFEAGLREGRLCLLSSMGHGLGTLSDEVREDMRRAATRTIDRFALVFAQGRREGSMRHAGSDEASAAAFLALLEGLQVLARTMDDPELFGAGVAEYIGSITGV